MPMASPRECFPSFPTIITRKPSVMALAQIHRRSSHKHAPGQSAEECPVDLTSQCTEQCVVITCDDPAHSASTCGSEESQCDLVCPSPEECHDCNGFDEFLQCCTGFHEYLPEHPTSYQWNDAPACSYRPDQAGIFDSNDQETVARAPSYPFGTLAEDGPTSSDIYINKIPQYSLDFPPPYPIQTSLPSQSHLHRSSPTNPYAHADFSPTIPSSAHSPASVEHHDSSSSATSHTCMWGNCSAQFPSSDELIQHVNSQHLMLSSQEDAPACNQSHEEAHKKFSCLWRDCQEFFPDLVDPSSRKGLHPPYDKFTVHILSEHLGYPGPHAPPLPKYPDDYPKEYLDMYARSFPSSCEAAPSDSSRSESVPSRSVTPQISGPEQDSSHQCDKEIHVCHWTDCGQAFGTCNDLTTHLSQMHVGSGKPHYDCYWGQCGRNGQNGFTSKQKICRHLQSHTGHRPFQCKICHQNFSEAATLQQHMRRHTREKPYVCDHPGCGKSFAITGALTIHKRTHNGHKPFKCTFCDRAFAESSNLSKHLRTHTGARPYSCPEPECKKSFARPDQLNRHANVHRKKAEKQKAALLL